MTTPGDPSASAADAAHPGPPTGSTPAAAPDDERAARVCDAMEVGYALLDPRWRITTFNTTATRLTATPAEAALGRSMWDVFPALAGSDFERHYHHAVSTGQTTTFEAHYPEPLNVWVQIRCAPLREGGAMELFFSDVTVRRTAEIATEVAHRRQRILGGLTAVALAVADAEDITALVTAITERGLPLLGCAGGSVAVPDPDDASLLRSYITTSFGQAVQHDYAHLPLDTALPVCVAAATGQLVLLADADASAAFSPAMAEVVAATGSQAWVSLPLRAGGQLLGVLSAGWVDPQPFDADQVELLQTYASQCTQALARLAAREAEHAATLAAQRATEAARDAAAAAQRAASAARTAAARQSGLVAIARALGRADSEDDVLAVVADQGVALLAASGSALALPAPTTTPGSTPQSAAGTASGNASGSRSGRSAVRVLTTDTFEASLRASVELVPLDFPLPIIDTAATGTTHFHTDRDQTVAAFPGALEVYTAGQVHASACVPLLADDRLLGALSLAFTDRREWPQGDRDLLGAFAALTAQALDRIGAREAEQAASAQVARFSETIQRSLLTSPAQPEGLQVAVRYVPAGAEAYVGGDWYDAFVTGSGVTSVVIGDVAGHDRTAAAAMGQLRNLLRGVAYTVGEPPAAVLRVLDSAAQAMGVQAMATAVLAQVEQTQAQRAAGVRTLRWANAGHPPPLLVTPEGRVEFLQGKPDLVLGIDPSTSRHDHEQVLTEGSVVLLYTDGLVERRGVGLDVGMDWLAGAAAELVGLGPEELCDALLALVGTGLEDDVALLALRAGP